MKVSAESSVAVPDGPAQRWSDDDAAAVSRQLDDLLPDPALFRVEGPARLPGQRAPWRLSPEPFWLSPELVETLEGLGADLLAFYQACNRLYQASVRGRVPSWVTEYLDAGRPDQVVLYGRMNRFRRHTPLVIRPDLFFTDQGLKATELDSVPGGMGFTASLAQAYASLGYEPVGGARGMVERFAAMAQSAATMARDAPADGILAIVVSQESADYWPEMQWLATAVDDLGVPAVAVRPEEVVFTEAHLQAPYAGGLRPVSVVYRFFELFDLPNIPKYELILYAAKKGRVAITPPLKSYLEEKLLFALFHHPVLADFWREQLGAEVQQRLAQVIPETWVLDPAPLPPAATIPGLRIADRPVQSWDQLRGLTQKWRQLVLKPSGFDPLAWGSRGVSVGHDMAAEDWEAAVDTALARFPRTRYVLQHFYRTERSPVPYFDFARNQLRLLRGRARLNPYYLVVGDQAHLAGVLVTVCPPDKKVIHGMVDAVMSPGALGRE